MTRAEVAPRRRRILIVEDEYLIAADLEAYLVSSGFEVVGPVGTIEAAEALAASAPLDAAILDLSLRGRPVFPAARRLFDRNIPFILVSGHTNPDLPDWVPTDNARFSKPMNLRRIVASVRSLT